MPCCEFAYKEEQVDDEPFYSNTIMDLLCSWEWEHNSAHAPCRGSAPPSRPQPAAPRCCNRPSWRASFCARTQTVCVRRDPEPQEGLRSRSLPLNKQHINKSINELWESNACMRSLLFSFRSDSCLYQTNIKQMYVFEVQDAQEESFGIIIRPVYFMFSKPLDLSSKYSLQTRKLLTDRVREWEEYFLPAYI